MAMTMTMTMTGRTKCKTCFSSPRMSQNGFLKNADFFLIFYQYGIAEQKYLLCERVYSLYIHRTEEFEYLFKGRGN